MNVYPAKKTSDDSVGVMIAVIIFALVWSHRSALSVKTISVIVVFTMALLLLVTKLYLNKKLYIKRSVLKPAKWNIMTGQKFEDQIVIWLKLCGYVEVVKTEYFDQGIDIVAAKPGIILGVQVKRSSKLVGVSAVRAAIAGLKSYGCSQAMVVTNADYTQQAISLARVNGCRLVSGEELKLSAEQFLKHRS